MKSALTKFMSVFMILAVIFTFLPQIAFAETATTIPNDAVIFNEHAYKIYDEALSWADAKNQCEVLGGHLATITSKAEDDFLYQYIKSKGFGTAYFGATDEEVEGTWKWVTGEAFDYSNWSPGEPNDFFGLEDYAMYYWSITDGTWNDAVYDVTFAYDYHGTAFICEWDDIYGHCNIIDVLSPVSNDYTYSPSDTTISATIPVSQKSVTVNLRVSGGATWVLYTNEKLRKPISNIISFNKIRSSIVYIKVTAADGVTYKIYKMTIKKA